MRNSAFAVDPCPRDLLGKQWLFAHMSSHYRRMWAAQSVVDSAPPASLKARATPRSASRTARPARLSQKPSRADTDPGPCRAGRAPAPGRPPRPPGSASRGSRGAGVGGPGSLDGRSSAASAASAVSASRRQLEHSTSSALRKPRRRDQDKPNTYYETLKLVPDHAQQWVGHGPKAAQFHSEVFTPRVPHKPQILRTEVPSRLRSSSTYCPPRSKPLQLKNSGAGGQHVKKDVEQSMWTAQASPPVSSRDSAYNGGISSGGESRGPTPDQKGNRKHSKRTERKVRKKVDQKRPASADAKTRRKFENKLRKKLLEDERNELQEQRRRVVPWNGISQDDHGDEIQQNTPNSRSESHESLMEHESPVHTESVSDQSVEEDMEEGADEAIEVDVAKDEKEDSVIRDGSSSSIVSERSQQSITSSSLSNKQAAAQTDTQSAKDASRIPLSSSSISLQGRLSPSQPAADSSSMSSIKNTTGQSLIIPANKQPSAETSLSETSMNSPQESVEQQILPEQTEKSKLFQNEITSSIRAFELNIRSQTYLDKIDADFPVKKERNSLSYTRLVHNITEEVVKNIINTNPGLKAVYKGQIEANCHKLDPIRMQEEVDKLHFQLQIPRDQYLESVTDGENMLKTTAEVTSSPLDAENFSPLFSEPSEIWSHYVQQNQTLQTTLGRREESPFQTANDLQLPSKAKELGLHGSQGEPFSLFGGGVGKVCAGSAEISQSKLMMWEPKTVDNVDKLTPFSSLHLPHTRKSNDNTLNVITSDLQNVHVLDTPEKTTFKNVGSTSPVLSGDLNSTFPVPSSLSNVLRGGESSLTSQYLPDHAEILNYLSSPIRSLSIFSQKETASGHQKDVPEISSPIAHTVPLCVCKEKICRCSSSTLLKSYMEAWQDGESSTPSINTKQCNKLEDMSRCHQSSQFTSSVKFGAHLTHENKEVDSKATKDCKCKTPVENIDLGVEKKDNLEVYTLFCKDRKASGILMSDIKTRNTDIVQKNNCDLEEISDKSWKSNISDALGSSLLHSREQLYSLPIGTGVNSDILNHLRGLELGEDNTLS